MQFGEEFRFNQGGDSLKRQLVSRNFAPRANANRDRQNKDQVPTDTCLARGLFVASEPKAVEEGHRAAVAASEANSQ